MGDFYQGERLGYYYKFGNSQDGRNTYKQINGNNYLYYLANGGVIIHYIFQRVQIYILKTALNSFFQYWIVGEEIGRDLGGFLNPGSSFCPEDSTAYWQYWADWMQVCIFVQGEQRICERS